MDKSMKIALLVGIGILIVANTFAPWRVTLVTNGHLISKPEGHHCIFFNPRHKISNYGLEVDNSRVINQSVSIILGTAGVMAGLCCRKRKTD